LMTPSAGRSAEAVVRTPVPLGAELLECVRERLEKALERPVHMTEQVDEHCHSASCRGSSNDHSRN
jgi:F0F1-type ATP synthase delta subunit